LGPVAQLTRDQTLSLFAVAESPCQQAG
jgi:hypothetical protein